MAKSLGREIAKLINDSALAGAARDPAYQGPDQLSDAPVQAVVSLSSLGSQAERPVKPAEGTEPFPTTSRRTNESVGLAKSAEYIAPGVGPYALAGPTINRNDLTLGNIVWEVPGGSQETTWWPRLWLGEYTAGNPLDGEGSIIGQLLYAWPPVTQGTGETLIFQAGGIPLFSPDGQENDLVLQVGNRASNGGGVNWSTEGYAVADWDGGPIQANQYIR